MSVLGAFSGPYIPVKASGVLRRGSGSCKIHVASPLTLIQHLAKKSTRATAAWTPRPECSSLAGPSLPAQLIVVWSKPLFTLRHHAGSQWAEMKLCIQDPEPIFTFKFVSNNHMHVSIYKQQHYAENTLQPQSQVQTSSSERKITVVSSVLLC